MKQTLYFAKLNLCSSEIYELYDKKITTEIIMGQLLKGLSYAKTVSIINTYTLDGKNIERESDYTFVPLHTSEGYIHGKIVKESELEYKKLAQNGELLPDHVDHAEDIWFVVSQQFETVVFATKQRFGYKEFNRALECIINSNLEDKNSSFRFSVALLNSTLNLEELKKELQCVGKIDQLEIIVQPPNPDSELLNTIQQEAEETITQMKAANLKKKSVVFTSAGPSGLNLSSNYIDNELSIVQGVHSRLSAEDALGKGYVVVKAVGQSGEKFSSLEARPVKSEIKSMREEFDVFEYFEKCKKSLQEVIFRLSKKE